MSGNGLNETMLAKTDRLQARCEELGRENGEHALKIDALERELAAEREISRKLLNALYYIRDGATGLYGDELIACNKAIAAYERTQK